MTRRSVVVLLVSLAAWPAPAFAGTLSSGLIPERAEPLLEVGFVARPGEVNRVRGTRLANRAIAISDSFPILLRQAPGCSHVAGTAARRVVCRGPHGVLNVDVVLGDGNDSYVDVGPPPRRDDIQATFAVADGAGNDVVVNAWAVENGLGNDLLRGINQVIVDTARRQQGPGNDRLYGTAGADILEGGTGNDLILGLAGNDALEGGAGVDVIHGGPGNDTLLGGPGIDRLFAAPGRDRVDGLIRSRRIG